MSDTERPKGWWKGWKRSILNRLEQGSGKYEHFHPNNTFAMWALGSLYDEGYIDAWGKEWNTAIFVITDKGRELLQEMKEEEAKVGRRMNE